MIRHASRLREVIVPLLLLIMLGGLLIAEIEGLKLVDAIYFAFITAVSVGYGDMHPNTTIGKLLSVGIGLIGMLSVGITFAIANRPLLKVIIAQGGLPDPETSDT